MENEVIGQSNEETQATQEQHIDIGLDSFKHDNGKIFGKFETARDLGDAYRNIEKEFSKTRKELSESKQSAPEKYEFTLDDDIKEVFQFDENHPDYQRFIPLLKANNVPQEVANKLANEYARSRISESADFDLEGTLKELGGYGGEVLQNIKQYASTLKTEEVNILDKMVSNKEQALMLNKLINASRGSNDIPMSSGSDAEYKSAEDYMAEAFKYREDNDKTIGYNEQQQQHYQRLMEKAVAMKK